MSKRVPKFIADQYGGAHAFRSEKRRQLRELERVLAELRLGCSYFPGGEEPINAIADRVALLKSRLSVADWGR